MDDTEISPQQVTSHKITVSRRDITGLEETEKPRYPKGIHAERILIDEIPEEKGDATKRDSIKFDEVKPRRDMETIYQVERGQKTQVDEERVRIGKLDVRDYEKITRTADQLDERITNYIERKQKHHEVILLAFIILLLFG